MVNHQDLTIHERLITLKDPPPVEAWDTKKIKGSTIRFIPWAIIVDIFNDRLGVGYWGKRHVSTSNPIEVEKMIMNKQTGEVEEMRSAAFCTITWELWVRGTDGTVSYQTSVDIGTEEWWGYGSMAENGEARCMRRLAAQLGFVTWAWVDVGQRSLFKGYDAELDPDRSRSSGRYNKKAPPASGRKKTPPVTIAPKQQPAPAPSTSAPMPAKDGELYQSWTNLEQVLGWGIRQTKLPKEQVQQWYEEVAQPFKAKKDRLGAWKAWEQAVKMQVAAGEVAKEFQGELITIA